MAFEKNEKRSDVCVISSTKSPETLKEKKSFWHINKEMLRFKFHFFLYNAAAERGLVWKHFSVNLIYSILLFLFPGLAPAIPFTVVFAKERLGLAAAASLGAVLTARTVLFIFTKTFIGYIADYLNRLKTIICILAIFNIMGYFLLLAVPKIERNENADSLTLFDDRQFNATNLQHICKEFQEHTRNDMNHSLSGPLRKIFNETDLPDKSWIFAFLFTFSSICSNAVFPFSDTACCESIQKTGAIFGRQRMWGSIGWGTFAPIAGILNDYTGDFLVSWTVMAIMLLLFLWNISKMELLKPHFSQNILRDVGSVFRSKEFLIFEVVIFMNGVGTGMVWFYLIWFVRSIGGSELLCGLSLAVQSFGGAIPFMFFSGWFIKKVGHFNLLIAALMTYVLRFLFYSYLYSPWWILPMELSHGVTFGLYYTVLASYGKMSSKPGVEATTQSVIFSTHEGLGASLGCVFAGIGFDYLECHRTFFFASLFFACGSLVGLMLRVALRRRTAVIKITSINEQ
ncbi:major facilitator superfamily domain-containing protein 6 [Caerostris darwini]|uniref:Major facilitator superfamily domain-containing protein 6 n=1 Tax=Caerostris darwini TaxID=1538125 RepID=A0AAV4QVU6_9ARAC|nr:major facilitator superfamily domain-containing protein 6 [Caerostris darwini]